MAKFGQEKVPELGFIRTERQGIAPVDYSGLAQAAVGLGKAIQKDRAEAAAEAQQETINEFEDDLADATRRSIHHGFLQQADPAAAEEEGLTGADQQVLSQARARASEIDAMEEQGKSATMTALQRDAIYSEYKARYPHLAPELREFFKKETGKSVLQSLIDIEQSAAEEATKEAEAEKNHYIQRAQALHIYNPNDTHQQRVAKTMPYEHELRVIQDLTNQSEKLKLDREIGHEQRRALQEPIFRRGVGGYAIVTNIAINDMMAETNFDPATATAEERAALLQRIEQHRTTSEVSLREAGSDLDQAYVDSRWNIINRQYDVAKDYMSGKITKEAYDTSNAIRLAAAENKLYNIPGMAEKMVVLEKYKGLPIEVLTATDRVRFGGEVAIPISQALLNSSVNPNINIYQQLEGGSTEAGKTYFYDLFSQVAKENLDNPEVRENLINNLEAFSHQFDLDPDSVNTGVYDKFLDISAQPGFIEAVKEGANLPANVTSGIREYTSRLQAAIAQDMSRDFSERVQIPGVTRSEADQTFINFITLGGLFELPGLKTKAPPKLVELVTVTPQEDGSLMFRPRGEMSKNLKVRNLSRELNKKYAKPLSRLSKSYAHIVKGNQDYTGALAEILGGQAFEPIRAVEPTGFRVEESPSQK